MSYISIILWFLLILFLISTSIWVFLMLLSSKSEKPDIVYGPEQLQIRILTVDNNSIVQKSVDSIQSSIKDIHVIAEKDMSIDGAVTHNVEEGFVCQAERKGRAIEWARRNIECDKEFILYLDEDSNLPEIEGLPDKDIIQLSESPRKSRGLIPYLCEVFRMGFQIEQRGFPELKYPLYAWGGGFAVRKKVEDNITWDVCTVTEDTNFIWRAFENQNTTMAYMRVRVSNQSPPSIKEMIHQRRRWVSGSLIDIDLLPYKYKLIVWLRLVSWGFLPLTFFLFIPYLLKIGIAFEQFYWIGVLIQTIFVIVWIISGVVYCKERLTTFVLILLLFPLISIIHSIGCSWGLVKKTDNFRPTKKIDPKED